MFARYRLWGAGVVMGALAWMPAAAQTSSATCPVPQDPSREIGYFADRMAQGDAESGHIIGVLYLDGSKSLPKDVSKAFSCFLWAAEKGYAPAQDQVGLMYITGQSVPVDRKKAVEWTQKAAEQGLADAEFKMGIFNESGRDIPQNYPKAVEWYRKAAEQGDPRAQLNLAMMYDNGNGVKYNGVEALKWYRLAGRERKDTDPKLTATANARAKKLETQMSPEDIAAANEQAASFAPVKKPVEKKAAP